MHKSVARFALGALLALSLGVGAQQFNTANNIAFTPLGKSSWLAAGTSSGNVLLSTSQATQVQVYNATSVAAYVNCGIGSGTTASLGTAGASTTDYPVAPGAVIVISVPPGTNYCAGILPSSSGQVVFSPGIGL